MHSHTIVLPATIQGIRHYLGSGLIKGIGPVMAERMVAHFGTGILGAIETQPGRLIDGRARRRQPGVAEARRSWRSSACPDSTPVRICRATASSSATCGLVRE